MVWGQVEVESYLGRRGIGLPLRQEVNEVRVNVDANELGIGDKFVKFLT